MTVTGTVVTYEVSTTLDVVYSLSVTTTVISYEYKYQPMMLVPKELNREN